MSLHTPSKKPIIGILSDRELKGGIPRYFVKSNYISAIRDTGGIPFIIPPLKDENDLEKSFELISGLLIPGGNDIDPKYFGEELHPSVVLTDPEITKFQIDFFKRALNKDIPVFGICAGLQIINVACGGNIYQDIPSQYSNPLRHKKKEGEKEIPMHEVKIEENTKLFDILQKNNVTVNSTHHQALKDVADGFVVTARSEDGIIEAIEWSGVQPTGLPSVTQNKLYEKNTTLQDSTAKHRYVLGVQWHPEDLYKKDELFLKLFERFVLLSKK